MQPEEILSRVLHRLDGVDHQYFASFNQSRKNQLDKNREFWTSVHWPVSDRITKMVNLRMIKEMDKELLHISMELLKRESGKMVI